MAKLTELGVDFKPSWTVPELRELYDKYMEKVDKLKPQTAATGLSKLSRAELAHRCKEQGVEVSEHATKVQMQAKLRARDRVLTLPADEDVLT